MTTEPDGYQPAAVEQEPDGSRLRVVFVAGGRHFGEKYLPPDPTKHRGAVARPRWKEERAFLYAELRKLHAHAPIERLVHGDCRTAKLVPTGADKWAALWAIHKGVWSVGYPAPFPALGKAAGRARTATMFDDWHPHHACTLVAFDGGLGTELAVTLAFERDMAVIDLRPVRRK